MNNVKIKKATIKDSLFLYSETVEELPGHCKQSLKWDRKVPIHEDLKTAFKKLHKHMAILCDEVKEPKPKDFDTTEFPLFTANGFSIGGNDDNEGVTISGSKEGKYGLVNLNTPFTKYENEEYPFIGDLGADIQACVYEVEQYLFEGKRAPEAQLEIGFPEEVEEKDFNN